MTIEETINKILDNINNFGEGIKSAILDKKDYNLEINREKTFQTEDKEKIKDIGRYLGTFIVTKNGYLRRGYDHELEKQYAQIMGSNPFLPPFIVYENKDVHKIIKTIFGLRFAEFKFQPQTQNKFSFAY